MIMSSLYHNKTSFLQTSLLHNKLTNKFDLGEQLNLVKEKVHLDLDGPPRAARTVVDLVSFMLSVI